MNRSIKHKVTNSEQEDNLKTFEPPAAPPQNKWSDKQFPIKDLQRSVEHREMQNTPKICFEVAYLTGKFGKYWNEKRTGIMSRDIL